jgi:hypothetical protein
VSSPEYHPRPLIPHPAIPLREALYYSRYRDLLLFPPPSKPPENVGVRFDSAFGPGVTGRNRFCNAKVGESTTNTNHSCRSLFRISVNTYPNAGF